MKDGSLVSVIIPVYNNERTLKKGSVKNLV
ncbi:hypothetical protein IMAU70092_03095 [Lactiplantibacillus plantarum]|nr:hypothetical protein [Lactiplantibacillus plantarum]